MFQKYRSRCCYIICVLFSNKYWVQISGVMWHVSIWMAVWVMHETYITSSSVSWTEPGVVVELPWKGCGAPSSGELRKRRPSIMGATKPFPISTYLSAVIPPTYFWVVGGVKSCWFCLGDIFFSISGQPIQTERLFTASIGTYLSLFFLWGANVGWRPNYDLGAIIGG